MDMPYIKVFLDLSATVDLLSDAEAGRLLKALLHYGNGGEDELLGQEKLVFAMLRAQIDRDAANYATYTAKQRENGAKGGRPRKPTETQQNPKNPSLFLKTQKSQDKDKDKDEDKDEGVVIRPRETAPLPFGLTDAEIDASLTRDQQIEQAARDAGLPFFPANILTARDLANEYGTEWLLEAIRRAADGKSQTWGYVKGILRSWKERGGMDAENKAKTGGKRVSAQAYTQREYTDAELNAGTLELLKEAMELG